MLKKTRPFGSGKAKVTFLLHRHDNAHHVHLAGDFNGWQSATPMKKQKDGSWSATLELDPGREYEFRYLVDGNTWINDDAADAYVANPFGADNSVVRVEAGAPADRTALAGGGQGGRGEESGAGAAKTRSGGKGGRARTPGSDLDMAASGGERAPGADSTDGSGRGRTGRTKRGAGGGRQPEGGSGGSRS